MPPPIITGARSILDSATCLFARHGYDCVSAADIATHAGVSKANVFHHYESKEALYLAVVRQASVEHADHAEALYRQPGTSADKVCKLIEFEIRMMLSHVERTRLLLREAAEDGQTRARKLARQVFQRNFSAVVAIFEQGRESGEFRETVDPAAAAMLLGGAGHFFFRCREALSEFRGTRELEAPEVYAQRVGGMILAGVVAQPALAAAAPRRRVAASRKQARRGDQP